NKSEPRLLRKREAEPGFALRLGKRVARRKKVRVQLLAAVSGVSEVADLVCRLEGAAHQIAAGPNMSRPGKNAISELQIGPGLETRQSASFDQVVAEPTKAIYVGAIVAEARAGGHGQHYVDATRSVAVAALEAKNDPSAGDQGEQVRIRIERRCPHLG